jgi:hypothetical protein
MQMDAMRLGELMYLADEGDEGDGDQRPVRRSVLVAVEARGDGHKLTPVSRLPSWPGTSLVTML